ncbi:sigma-70 family RNA polymerase sigma factor [Hyphomonas sp.]|uniref:sigma-70 family RNA polymerase sigma factor n=1 Tax=Hyphomonas sp. TaxID=87 RepID=UPI00356B0CBF
MSATIVHTADLEQRERHADCMERIAADESREAFAELFAFFAPRLKAYMLRLGAAEPEAEELTQDVMMTVWRKAGMYDRKQASVSTWIFRVARNRRIDVQRRTSKPPLEPDEPMLRPAEAEQPDSAVFRMQMEEQVRAQLATLPDEQLALLRAAFYDGLSHSEIALSHGLPLGTVKSRIRLALARLRGGLDDPE